MLLGHHKGTRPNDQVEGRAATDARKEECPPRRVPSNAWLGLSGIDPSTMTPAQHAAIATLTLAQIAAS